MEESVFRVPQVSYTYFKQRELTAISCSPNFVARCSEVLPLSSRSGFWSFSGLFLTMRLKRTRSLRWMARLRRTGTVTLVESESLEMLFFMGRTPTKRRVVWHSPQPKAVHIEYLSYCGSLWRLERKSILLMCCGRATHTVAATDATLQRKYTMVTYGPPEIPGAVSCPLCLIERAAANLLLQCRLSAN